MRVCSAAEDQPALAQRVATAIFAWTSTPRRIDRASTSGSTRMRASVGLTLVLIGTILVVVGLLTWAGALSWFGRLPGDIRIERANMRMYIPLTSMLLVSVVLSLVAALIHRFR